MVRPYQGRLERRRLATRWLEISIRSPGEYAEPLAHLFSRYGDGRVVVEEPGGFNPDEGETPSPDAFVVVKGYLPVDATTDSRRAGIDAGIRLVGHIHALPPLEERVLDDSEWRRQRFDPVRVGERLVIAPAGADWRSSPRDVLIPLDPGVAFGTGHHPTTRMCLIEMERLVRSDTRVLDVGCGSGILAIAAMKLGARRAVCLDTDGEAVDAARSNLAVAGIRQDVVVEQGTLPHAAAPAGEFDLVLANISSKVLVDLAGSLMETVSVPGAVVASGLMTERRSEVEEAFKGTGGRISRSAVTVDWVALVIERTQG